MTTSMTTPTIPAIKRSIVTVVVMLITMRLIMTVGRMAAEADGQK